MRTSAVVGVGIDVIEVSRIARAMEDPGFAPVVLTPAEMSVPVTPDRLAGRWAAKEAVAKAVGTHLRWHDVEILDDAGGKTTVSIRAGKLRESVAVSLTITVSADVACALAIAEAAAPFDGPD